MHRELLIHQSVVAVFMAFGIDRGLREEAEVAESVIDGDYDDALIDKWSGIIVGAGATGQAAAVNPEHHGKPMTMQIAVPPKVGHVDIQEQAILTAGAVRLSAFAAERRRVEQAVPLTVRRRPAQVTDRRRGVRDTQELVDVPGDNSLKRSAIGPDEGRPIATFPMAV